MIAVDCLMICLTLCIEFNPKQVKVLFLTWEGFYGRVGCILETNLTRNFQRQNC